MKFSKKVDSHNRVRWDALTTCMVVGMSETSKHLLGFCPTLTRTHLRYLLSSHFIGVDNKAPLNFEKNVDDLREDYFSSY